MKKVSLTIDGKEINVEEQTTLLQAARAAGIQIPTLCHDDRLAPHGSCRLCSVEITSGKKARIVASCVYPAANGLVVETKSPRVVKIRKVILELLQASSPKGRVEELGRIYGTSTDKFEKELTFCILCGLCVRYCSEVKKADALGFIGRGIEKQVVFFPEIALKSCPACEGQCFSLCPTGILPNKFARSVPSFGRSQPTVFPVRLWDEENFLNLTRNIE
jgi:NADH dehydrogenase/NADH:ubiquinone oxidoreductase subunit G